MAKFARLCQPLHIFGETRQMCNDLAKRKGGRVLIPSPHLLDRDGLPLGESVDRHLAVLLP